MPGRPCIWRPAAILCRAIGSWASSSRTAPWRCTRSIAPPLPGSRTRRASGATSSGQPRPNATPCLTLASRPPSATRRASWGRPARSSARPGAISSASICATGIRTFSTWTLTSRSRMRATSPISPPPCVPVPASRPSNGRGDDAIRDIPGRAAGVISRS